MLETTGRQPNSRLKSIVKASIALTLVCAAFLLALTAYAWFYYGRTAAGVVEISNPNAIFINAANQEDIRFFDLGNIDVEDRENGEGQTYKDIVFCIKGKNVHRYKIQLAYTTNNQFEYEIYHAELAENEGSVPGNAMSHVIYDTHDSTPVTQHYYVPAGSTKLAGSLLNDAGDPDEKLAKDQTEADFWYKKTYAPDENETDQTYDYHHKYAVPLYWQTDSLILNPEEKEFCHYYVLRVVWESGAHNDKETDIIYISAKNLSA